MLIVALLAVNAIVHAIVIARFGMRNNNQPFLIFALVDAALAIAVYLAVPYALWAVLILSIFGLIGLTVTFNQTGAGKTLDKVIWGLDVSTVCTRRICCSLRSARSGVPGLVRRHGVNSYLLSVM